MVQRRPMRLSGGRATGVMAALLALSAYSTTACAQESPATRPTAHLVYAVDPAAVGCPDASALRQAVTTRLGQDPFTDGALAELRIAITRVRDRLVGRVSAFDPGGREVGAREVTTRFGACPDLVEVLAVTASLAFEQPALRRPVVAPPAPAPASLPPPPAQPPAPPSASLRANAALERIEAVLVADGERQRHADMLLVTSLGVTSAALLGAGAYAVVLRSDTRGDIAQNLFLTGAALAVTSGLIGLLSRDPTRPLLNIIRTGRAAGADPVATLAATEAAWALAAQQHRARRRRTGLVLLVVGGALTVAGAYGSAALANDDAVSSGLDLAVLLVGGSTAVIGAWEVFLPGSVEQSWLTYRALGPVIVRPVAALTGQGAVLGLAGTF